MKIEYKIVPNFARLGPRLRDDMPSVKARLAELPAGEVIKFFRYVSPCFYIHLKDKKVLIHEDDLDFKMEVPEGMAAAAGDRATVAIKTELTPVLEAEGLANNVIRVAQMQRKELGLDPQDEVMLGIHCGADARCVLDDWCDHIMHQTKSYCICWNQSRVGTIVYYRQEPVFVEVV